ncbi:hypothetical protein QJS04_geneDACA008284 [Acorus gramineus]|uniref:Uncharacterized protein n=1 Tax=Acorus gramineus TaxID=55184 RepID=A0AAV9AZ09_ACOGR|nr:hypothetical protein QJS04_geneDACA008284 [Acorus gramineus]
MDPKATARSKRSHSLHHQRKPPQSGAAKKHPPPPSARESRPLPSPPIGTDTPTAKPSKENNPIRSSPVVPMDGWRRLTDRWPGRAKERTSGTCYRRPGRTLTNFFLPLMMLFLIPYLSLDINALEARLANVDLHERLFVEVDVLSTELLEKTNAQATESSSSAPSPDDHEILSKDGEDSHETPQAAEFQTS